LSLSNEHKKAPRTEKARWARLFHALPIVAKSSEFTAKLDIWVPGGVELALALACSFSVRQRV